MPEASQIKIVCSNISGSHPSGVFDLGAKDLRMDCTDHAACDVVLEVENVGKVAIVLFSPKVIAALGLDELSDDANTLTSRPTPSN